MDSTNFVDLLNSQQDVYNPQPFLPETYSQLPVFTETSSVGEETTTDRKERKKWSPTDDSVLISAWLNTSKDPVVGNEQKAGAFWKRIADYFAASPKIGRDENREAIQCKQRWQKLNDLVCKFSGSYDAATRQKTSGQNENDVVKAAHEFFYNDYKMKFNLQHAWEELRYDQKWCEVATNKLDGTTKKRKCDDGAQSSSSQATANQGEQRPPGVKASKRGCAKRTVKDGKDLAEIHSLWAIKEKDLEVKERLSRMGLLETLIAKKVPLSEVEEALKTKLITELLGKMFTS